MDIRVTSRHGPVNEELRAYAEQKAEKMPRYFDRVQEVRVVLDRTNHGYEIELVADAEHADPFVGQSHGQDPYACIDEASGRLERQLSEHKKRLRNRKHARSS